MYKYLLFIFLFTTACVNATEIEKDFFQKYIDLNDSFNLSVTELYSDTASIRAYRKYPHGLERTMELTGVQWKSLIIKAMPLAKKINDKSTFSNIIFSKKGNSFKIKADRYSESKCYLDKGYFMVIEPNNNGKLVIIEEYMETQPQSSC